jgi:hypothetical protein
VDISVKLDTELTIQIFGCFDGKNWPNLGRKIDNKR